MNAEMFVDFLALCSLIANVNITPAENGLNFTLNKVGRYTVKNLTKLVDSKIAAPSNSVQINWSKAVPLKIRCFIWRAIPDRIPVLSNLETRGVILQSSMCPLCKEEKETGEHLLIKCKIAKEARDWILKWCGIPTMSFNNMTELLNFAANWGNCPAKKKGSIR